MNSFVLPIIDFDLYMRDKTTLAAINECKKVEASYVGAKFITSILLILVLLDCGCFARLWSFIN